jgi:hypothetical protein
MVQAIREGRKTETQQVVEDTRSQNLRSKAHLGDLVYVRERWRPATWEPNELRIEYSDAQQAEACTDESLVSADWLVDLHVDISDEQERKGAQLTEYDIDAVYTENLLSMRSPAVMPKAFARLILKVEHVYVTSLSGMTEQDARREGFETLNNYILHWNQLHGPNHFQNYGIKPVRVYSFRLFGDKTIEKEAV